MTCFREYLLISWVNNVPCCFNLLEFSEALTVYLCPATKGFLYKSKSNHVISLFQTSSGFSSQSERQNQIPYNCSVQRVTKSWIQLSMHAVFYFYCYYLCSFLVSHQIWFYLNHDLRSYSCWILKIYWGYYKKLIGWENCPLKIFETQKTREIGEK